MPQIHAAISCNLDNNLLMAALPLFASEKVQAIEWSFDALYQKKEIPEWFLELIGTFSEAQRLIGHGIFFSLFSGKWTKEQENWLANLRKTATKFPFDHITEHFGFMTGEDFHKGAPLSIPFTQHTLALGIDRLWRIQEAGNCPVGLENLAFSYSLEEVKKHGDFLHQLITPMNGFIILDLHNLYCQLHNFEVDFEDVIRLYPLENVREIHISGGSWAENSFHPDKKIRRDTHDDAVPETVFSLLQQTIPLCPNLKYVVLEQLGPALASAVSQAQFQSDFYRLSEIVEKANLAPLAATIAAFLPTQKPNLPQTPVENIELAKAQLELSNILENAANYTEAQAQLSHSSLANSAWEVEQWKPEMLETALAIAQKWKAGWEN